MQLTLLRKQATAIATGTLFSFTAAVQATPVFSDMYIFGDSLSDTGNVADFLGSGFSIIAHYGDNGRFSNGPVWHEYLSNRLGMAPEENQNPSVVGSGNNYAYGGALVDEGDAIDSIAAYSFRQQIDYWDANYSVDTDALYINWIGGNNIRALITNGRTVDQNRSAIDEALDSMMAGLNIELTNGVTNLLVPNLPDIGVIPEFAGDASQSAEGTALTDLWNVGLEQRLTTLNNNNPNANIYHFDVNSLFGQMIADPSVFGFTDVTSECRSIGGWFGFRYEIECADADTTLFWDEIHPTTAAHNLLAGYAYDLLRGNNAVSSPAPALLMLLGLALLTKRSQRSKTKVLT